MYRKNSGRDFELPWQKPSEQVLNKGVCTRYPEERIIDYVAGKLSPEECLQMEEHRVHCTNCQLLIKEWREVLGRMDELSGLTAKTVEEEVSSAAVPPKGLKYRLLLRFRLRSLMAHLSANRYRYGLSAFGGSLVIALICGLLMLRPAGNMVNQAGLEQKWMNQIQLIKNANTEKYVIEPMPPYYGEGTVWLERNSGEMLIVVNGLHSVVEKDYQIWLQKNNEENSPGLLPVSYPEGISFYHGFGATDVERLIISVEPKGGSRVKTGPEAVLVEMKR